MKKIMLFMLLALSLSMFSCGGGGAGSADTPKGENPGFPSIVKLSPSQFIAQTNSYIFLHAKVLDGNGKPVDGVRVTFTNLSDPFGKITSAVLRFLGVHKAAALNTSTAKTNSQGIATVKLSSTIAGFATIQAEVNKGAALVRDRKTVFFTSTVGTTTPPPPTLTLHVDDGDGTYDEPADFELLKTSSDNQRTIKAVVLDGFGVPLSGVAVTFGSDLPGEVTFTPSTPVLTNSNGEASVILTVNPSIITDLERILNITAVADNGAAGMLSLTISPVKVGKVTVSANPSIVTTNGTSSITATVTLAVGGAAPDGTTVNFSATCDGTDVAIAPFAQTTDGIAGVTFTAPSTPGICSITATAGGVPGSTTVNVVTSSLVIIPAVQTLSEPSVSEIATYNVIGGVGPYSAFSDNPGLVTAPSGTFGGPAFNVTVVNIPSSDTTVKITVTDSRGVSAQASLVLDVGPPVALSLNPISIALTGFTNPDNDDSDNVTFYIQGGQPPYSMYSDDDAIILSQGQLAGNSFTIDPEAVPAAQPPSPPATTTPSIVTLTVEDSLGATVTAKVSVFPAESFISTNPRSITVVHPTTIPFHILGGLPNYTIFPDVLGVLDIGGNPLVTTAPFFTGDTNCPGTVNLQIVDSNGKTTTAKVTVVAESALSVLPDSQTLVNPAAGAHVDYTVTGGIGPYTAISDHPSLVSVPAGTFVGPTLTATVVAVPTEDTTVKITVVDHCGSTVGVNLELHVTDTTPPTVIFTNPANSATVVPVDQDVTIIWSESINCATVTTANITSDNPSWTLSSCSGSQAVFSTTGQVATTLYHVTVTTAVTDLAGNHMAVSYPFSYTTAP